MMTKVLTLLGCILQCSRICSGYKFLFLPVLTKSHVMEQTIVARELVSRGHEAYMVVSEVFPMEKTIQEAGIKILRAKKPDGVFKSAHMSEEAEQKFTQILRESGKFMAVMRSANLHRGLTNDDCRDMIHDRNLLDQIQGHNFDLALVDSFPFAPCSALIPYHLGIPFVSLSAAYIPAGGLPLIPSFVPSVFGTFSDRMTFLERVTNLVLTATLPFMPITDPSSNSLLQDFPDPSGRSADSWADLLSKSSLFIMTRNHLLEWSIPSMPYYIMLAGITQKPAKALDTDLQTYMASAPQGVFIVSFGSFINTIDPTLLYKLFTAFEAHPDLRFLFRLSESDQKLHKDVPPNVRLVTWLPQNDVIGHVMTRGFITHCGNNGQHEAVYHGVPMIGLPIFGEQHHNCFRMAAKEIGICLDPDELTAEGLADGISRLTADGSFRDNVQKLSSIMKDEDLPPARAAYWMEHVTRHGSKHLRSASLDLPWYQYWMLDAIAFLLSVVVLVGFALFKCCKWVCCRRKSKAKVKDKVE